MGVGSVPPNPPAFKGLAVRLAVKKNAQHHGIFDRMKGANPKANIKVAVTTAPYVKRESQTESRTATEKARYSAKWGHDMTKWLITRVRTGRRWEIANFTGPSGAESRGRHGDRAAGE